MSQAFCNISTHVLTNNSCSILALRIDVYWINSCCVVLVVSYKIIIHGSDLCVIRMLFRELEHGRESHCMCVNVHLCVHACFQWPGIEGAPLPALGPFSLPDIWTRHLVSWQGVAQRERERERGMCVLVFIRWESVAGSSFLPCVLGSCVKVFGDRE